MRAARVSIVRVRALLNLAFALALAASGCHAERAPATTPARPVATADSTSVERRLEDVTRAHGGAGPWAVAGYRMGEHALALLGLTKGSFDLDVVHHSPRKVQYTCIADGAGAATGASVGKMNLSLTEAPASGVRTAYTRKSTGQTVTLRLRGAFVERFADVPRARLLEAGREVMGLPDDAIFEQAPDQAP